MTNRQIYDSTFTALATLDKQGKLPPTVKQKAIQLGNAYLIVHNQAVQALFDKTTPNLALVKSALDAYITYAGPYALEVQ